MKKLKYLVPKSIRVLGCLALLWSVGGAGYAKNPKPNIVLILSDDHATSAIGAYGSQIATTPNLDRLAAEGMLFTDCFVTNSICTPSRASILTGLYSHATGVTTNYTKLDTKKFQTYPQLLQQSGYHTALVGKSLQWKQPTGFDHWCTAAGAQYVNPKMNVNGAVAPREGYVGDVITQECLDWLDKRDRTKPFFLACQPSAAHAPFTPNPKDAKLFENEPIPTPATFDDAYHGRSGAGSIVKTRIDSGMTKAIQHWGYEVPSNLKDAKDGNGDSLKQWTYQWYLKNYLRCVKSIDDSVGALLKYLDEHDLASNTIVIYTSDQGMFLGEHGWFDKRLMYEESIHMPLMVRWPGEARAGSKQSSMVLNVDLAATLLDIAEVPQAQRPPMHGRSIRPLLGDVVPEDWRKSMYYRYYEFDPEFPWSDVRPHQGVRTADHKLIWFSSSDVWELYDLRSDPNEMRNEYSNPRYADVVKNLKQEMVRLERELGVERVESVEN